MKEVIVFIVCFLIVLFFYEMIFVVPMKKYRANKGKKKKGFMDKLKETFDD